MTAATDRHKTQTAGRLRSQLGALLTRARGDTPRREMARRLDCSDPTLVEVETGQANPTLARAAGLAVDYDVDLRIIDVHQLRELAAGYAHALGEAATLHDERVLDGAIRAIAQVITITETPGAYAGPWAQLAAQQLTAAQPATTNTRILP